MVITPLDIVNKREGNSHREDDLSRHGDHPRDGGCPSDGDLKNCECSSDGDGFHLDLAV